MYKTYTKTSTFDMDPEWTLRMGCENLKKRQIGGPCGARIARRMRLVNWVMRKKYW